MRNIHLDLDSPTPPFDKLRQTEWDLMQGYYQATMQAVKIVIGDLTTKNELMEKPENGCNEIMSSNEAICPAPELELLGYHYDDLKNEDDSYEDYASLQCPRAQIVEHFEYDEAETFQSSYQLLNFVSREEDRDICFNLERTLQICSSYRPHYHEFFVSPAQV
jgi:hypothetical protein